MSPNPKAHSQQPLRPCHVLIAGSGIAGLTLALMLETHGIAYTLLEAYPELVPKVGAGICLLPNGLRNLDQLGCYDDLRSRVGENNLLESIYVRDPQGKELHYSEGWIESMRARYGYSAVWSDRSTILQTLYDHIVDKSRLLANKRVASVRHLEDGVEVTTADGSVYTGDILVGADGVHSRVREEIVRYANDLGVGEEYADGEEASAEYACLFGLSTSPPPGKQLPHGVLGWNLGYGHSYVIGTGPENRVYWLLSKRFEKPYKGSEIPRFTDEDRDRILREHWDDPITEELRLSDLYESRLHLVVSPLKEIVYRRWDCGRMVVLGDAGHKMLPIIAQGGNQAIETVAAFTNGLFSALTSSSSSSQSSTSRLSQEEITSIFTTLQSSRADRISTVVTMGHQRQNMDTMSSPEMEELMLKKFPTLLPGELLRRWDQTFPASVSLAGLERPFREKEVLFDDEKPENESGEHAAVAKI
ncbi:hypothetical protein BJY01DRAFT_104381 [Aspergillus pseudoustus]|uniref:FAD-binding domain-containing protein n=1 Tax=Aspergillus pseudoustus TaxID=1810923 RepID=A0ABR4KLA0_9EURO